MLSEFEISERRVLLLDSFVNFVDETHETLACSTQPNWRCRN